MTSWKDVSKIDAHIHLIPEEVREANKDYPGRFIVNGSAKDYVKLMEKYNIDRAFIMPFNDPRMLSMEFTVEAVHDGLLKIAQENMGAFYCFADVDISRDITDTLRELDRVLESEYFIGIKLHPENSGYPIDGPYYDQIFKYGERNDILIEIHSYPSEALKDDFSSPGRIKKILKKHPELRLSLAHLGGFQFQELIGTGLYANISAVLPDLVNSYGLGKTNKILRAFGTDRLIFASDYPDSRLLEAREIYDKYFQILDKMDFSQEEIEKICKTNALQMIEGS